MPRVTVSVDEDDKEYLQQKSADNAEYDSMSEVMRDCITAHKERDELQEEIERLRKRLDSKEERISELERQLSRRSEIEEKVDTLAKRQSEPDAPWPVRWLRWYRER